eukprot:GHVR01144066.1.p1 GENE.GHVR01144066.1~~GHVR01144066.1.p1  ORF type:complete len:620 (+),score=140.91 GHVR01144066.1:20-1879(+)
MANNYSNVVASMNGAPDMLKERMTSYLSVCRTESCHKELMELVEKSEYDELSNRLLSRLEFGTAGLRGAMGAGYNRMNLVTVMQAAQGLCGYLLNTMGEDTLRSRSVVIGYDGRYHSKSFAHMTAVVFMSKGVKPYLFSDVTPTPLIPFAICKLGAAAGVVVTASHNPKNDNGYKVYASNGAQIIPPMDTEISKCILDNQTPWEGVYDLLDPSTHMLLDTSRVHDTLDNIWGQYLCTVVKELCYKKSLIESSLIKFVYTALHGVGCKLLTHTLKEFGLTSDRLILVEGQCTPDPTFPTVAFPNPEEKGALNMSIKVADDNNVKHILANDPDADRFSAAQKLPDNTWKIFSGDELGILFAYYRYTTLKDSGVSPSDMMFICSAVSSRMLQCMCVSEGCMFEDTMTGFKWMSNKSIDIRNNTDTQSQNIIHCLAYEEAIGYQLTHTTPDKDGISAAAVWVEMCCYYESLGLSMTDQLDTLRKKYGYFVTSNGYYLCYTPETFTQCFNAMRTQGGNKNSYPTSIGGYDVVGVRDVHTGSDTNKKDFICTFPTISSEMVTITFKNGATITLRTSGTEPKLKWYAELSDKDPTKATELLADVLAAVCDELISPVKWGFTDPSKK